VLLKVRRNADDPFDGSAEAKDNVVDWREPGHRTCHRQAVFGRWLARYQLFEAGFS
jgi:hypothetical protein